jgi:hypothetical protein
MADCVLAEQKRQHTITKIPVTHIKEKKSVKYNTRPKGLDQEKVERLRRCIRNGRPFMRLVLRKCGNDYYVLGGNHRLAAMLAEGVDEVEAYVVVEDDDDECLNLAINFNQDTGEENTPTAMVGHAVDRVLHTDMQVDAAAKRFGVAKERVQEAMRREQVKDVALQKWNLDLNGTSNVNLEKLHKLMDQLPVMGELARAMCQYRQSSKKNKDVPSSDVDAILNKIKPLASEAEKIAAIKKYAADVLFNQEPAPKQRRSPKAKMKYWVHSMMNLLETRKTARSLGLAAPSEQTFLKDCEKLGKTLISLSKEA